MKTDLNTFVHLELEPNPTYEIWTLKQISHTVSGHKSRIRLPSQLKCVSAAMVTVQNQFGLRILDPWSIFTAEARALLLPLKYIENIKQQNTFFQCRACAFKP